MSVRRPIALFAVVLAFLILPGVIAIWPAGLQAQMQEGAPAQAGDEAAATQPAPEDDDASADPVRASYEVSSEISLEQHMEVLEGHVRVLRRMIPREEMNAEALPRVVEMQHAALHAKALLPRKAALVEEADRTTFVVEYQVQMATLVRSLAELELALLQNDTPAAQAAFAAVLKSRFDGHREYRVDDD